MNIVDNELLSMINLSIDGVFVENLEGDILMANQAGALLFGYSIDEVTKLNIRDFVPNEEKYYLKEVYKESDLFPDEYITRLNVKKDGKIIRTEVNSKIFIYNGIEYIIAYIRNPTAIASLDPKSPKIFENNDLIKNMENKNLIMLPIYNSTRAIKKEVIMNHVVYIESRRNKLFYYLVDGNIHEGYGTLNFTQQLLPINSGFLRCHQSYIANMNYAYLEESKHAFLMEYYSFIPITRRIYHKTKHKFNNFIVNQKANIIN